MGYLWREIQTRSLKGSSYRRQAPAFHVCLDGGAPRWNGQFNTVVLGWASHTLSPKQTGSHVSQRYDSSFHAAVMFAIDYFSIKACKKNSLN